MKFSDIQLTDKELWERYKQLWASGDYATALELLNNRQLDKKAEIAKGLNELTAHIVEVEKLNDPSYANDRIRIERQPPKDLEVGQVYFDWTNPPPYLWREVDALNYTFKDVDDLGLTWAEADKGGW